MLILHHILKPRRICDIYDLFVPFINLLTYLWHCNLFSFLAHVKHSSTVDYTR